MYAKDILACVRATFGIEYTISGMTHWLDQHGFAYKKPAVVSGKANPIAHELWIKEYESLKSTLSLAMRQYVLFMGTFELCAYKQDEAWLDLQFISLPGNCHATKK